MQSVSASAGNASGGSFAAGATAPGSIAALMGEGFATSETAASSRLLPTALGGVTLRVIDSAGVERPALLYLVSPRQIDYVVPAGTAPGRASLLLVAGERLVAAASVDVHPVAPALYSRALVHRVKADGAQSYETVSGPIDLGAGSDRVTLVLFGTGLRGRTGAAVARLGADSAAVAYAGPQAEFEGLDQVNIPLARGLRGRGQMFVGFAVDGREANPIAIAIR
jgi:uncharacterized protein (TIGR03437 family)